MKPKTISFKKVILKYKKIIFFINQNVTKILKKIFFIFI